jgi:hypothetical protein
MSRAVMLDSLAARPKHAPLKPAGMDELHVPINPSNIKTGGRFHVEGVTGDMYNIAEQLRELNPSLFINIIEDRAPNAQFPITYVIMERTSRGSEEVVFKCHALDGRVLEHVRYLLRVPFEHRFAEAEKELDKYEADEAELHLDELTEDVGLPMLHELKRLGFTDGTYRAGSTSRKAFGRGA